MKAEEILELAFKLAGRRSGMTIDDVREAFGWEKRTTQRRLRSVEELFPSDIELFFDDEGHKRWRLGGQHLRELMNLSADEMAAFELAVACLKRDGLDGELCFCVRSATR